MRAFASETRARSTGIVGLLWRRFPWLRSPEQRRARYSIAVAPRGTSTSIAAEDILPNSLLAQGIDDTAVATLPSIHHVTVVAGQVSDLEQSRQSSYGFLYLGLRPSHFTFGLRLFLVDVWMAACTVFISNDSNLQVFLMGLMSFWQMVSVGLEQPYNSWHTNGSKFLIRLATVGHTVLILGLQQQARFIFFSILLSLFVLAGVCSQPYDTAKLPGPAEARSIRSRRSLAVLG